MEKYCRSCGVACEEGYSYMCRSCTAAWDRGGWYEEGDHLDESQPSPEERAKAGQDDLPF